MRRTAVAVLILVAGLGARAQEAEPAPDEARVREDLDRVLRSRVNRGELDRQLQEWKRTGERSGGGGGGGGSGRSGGGGQPVSEDSRRLLERILREETYEEGDPQDKHQDKDKGPEEGGRGPEADDSERASRSRSRGPSGPSGGGGGGAGVLWMILILICAVVLALAIYAFLTYWRDRRLGAAGTTQASPAGAKAPAGGAAPPERRDPEEWLREARRLAAEGRHAEALRCLLHAAMERLHRARAIDYERARTNRECLRLFRGEPQRRDAFATLVDAFDFTFYGKRPFGAADYVRVEANAMTLAGGADDDRAA